MYQIIRKVKELLVPRLLDEHLDRSDTSKKYYWL